LDWIEAIMLVTQFRIKPWTRCASSSHRKKFVDLTAAAVAINAWNRIAIGFRIPPQVEGNKAAA
jgi:alkylhydroperoxidase family enzyme